MFSAWTSVVPSRTDQENSFPVLPALDALDGKTAVLTVCAQSLYRCLLNDDGSYIILSESLLYLIFRLARKQGLEISLKIYWMSSLAMLLQRLLTKLQILKVRIYDLNFAFLSKKNVKVSCCNACHADWQINFWFRFHTKLTLLRATCLFSHLSHVSDKDTTGFELKTALCCHHAVSLLRPSIHGLMFSATPERFSNKFGWNQSSWQAIIFA